MGSDLHYECHRLPVNRVPNIDEAEKIAYLVVTSYNDQWSHRFICGFGIPFFLLLIQFVITVVLLFSIRDIHLLSSTIFITIFLD